MDENTYYEFVRNRVMQMLRESPLSYKKMADKTGIAPQTIQAYGSGRNIPTAARLGYLCKALGVSPNWVLGFSERRELHEN